MYSRAPKLHKVGPEHVPISLGQVQLERLQELLEDYRTQQRNDNAPPIWKLEADGVRVYGFHRLHRIFTQVVLETVVDLARTPGRDTFQRPIAIAEVGDYFTTQTGVNVRGALKGRRAVRFVHAPHLNWTGPEFGEPADKLTDLPRMYVGAYSVVRAEAYDRPDLLGRRALQAATPTPIRAVVYAPTVQMPLIALDGVPPYS